MTEEDFLIFISIFKFIKLIEKQLTNTDECFKLFARILEENFR